MNKPPRMNLSNIDTSTPFTRMVDEDIIRCDSMISGEFDKKLWKELHVEMTAKYSAHLQDIGSDMYDFFPNGNFFGVNGMGGETLRHNISVIKNKLIAFKNYGYRNRSSNSNGINIENNLTANQTQMVNISFEDVKQQIKDMVALSDKETEETLAKVDDIKAIVESQELKKTKWQKIKPILIWLADKSVDVGIALLPLLLKVGG